MKKLVSLVLSLVLLLSVTLPAAATNDYEEAAQTSAEELYELGLFRGTGTQADGSPIFALDEQATRGQAITMLVRLLGEESEALKTNYTHPFRDTGWAEHYIGYAYENGISNGVSTTKFGTEDAIETAQFLTLVLRAMGYSEVDWRDPYPTADAVGLDYWSDDCLRGDIAIICRSALECELKDSGKTLYEDLDERGVFDQTPIQPDPKPDPQPDPQPSKNFGPQTKLITDIYVSSGDDMLLQMANVVQGRTQQLKIHVPAWEESGYSKTLNAQIDRYPDLKTFNVSWMDGSGVLTVAVGYDDAATAMAYLEGKRSQVSADVQQVLAAAQRVKAEVTHAGMSDYEIVKAYHDYLVNFNTYRETGARSHSAIGALVDGYTVCEGYADAFDLLCYLSGIENLQITGKGFSGGGSENHAWNKVLLNGSWYNVDITWDDPVSTQPILRYDYFLISDSQLGKDHQWFLYPHWPTANSNYA